MTEKKKTPVELMDEAIVRGFRGWSGTERSPEPYFGTDRTKGINRKSSPWWEEIKTRLSKAWQALRGSYD